MQEKFGHLTDVVIARRQCQHREHLANLLRPHGDALGDCRIKELFHRAGFDRVASQVAVFSAGGTAQASGRAPSLVQQGRGAPHPRETRGMDYDVTELAEGPYCGEGSDCC